MDSVVIYNRLDCCSERINGAKVLDSSGCLTGNKFRTTVGLCSLFGFL